MLSVYGIPKTTLFDHMQMQQLQQLCAWGDNLAQNLLEDQLFEYALTMSEMFYGLTQHKHGSLAYELA